MGILSPRRVLASLFGLGFALMGCGGDERPPAVFFDAGSVDRPAVDSSTPPVDATVDASGDATTADAPTVTTVFRNVRPSSGAFVPSRRPTFSWVADAMASGYRVELSASRAFGTITTRITVMGATTGRPEADLPAGRHWWRVVPLRGAEEGSPSAAWPVVVGTAVSDLNGDGRSDLVVGAKGHDSVTPNAGRVYVFPGGPELAMGTSPLLSLDGAAENDFFGQSVSSRGDLNGDGICDLAVGAPFATQQTGRAYVFLGGATPSTMPAASLTGPATGADFGRSVAIVGDVNGDGFDDLLVGASTAMAGGTTGGRAYLYFGGSTFDTTPDLTLDAAAAGDQFGRVVSAAGDVNGDGYADFLVGAPRADGMAGADIGAAYLYLGGATPDATADLVVRGVAMDDLLGAALSAGGDLNSDGYGEFVVGTPQRMRSAGAALVFAGSPMPTSTPLATLSGTASMGPGESLGRAVASAGDVNGDGFDDLLVGSPFFTVNGELAAGRVFLHLGAASGLTAMPAASFSGSISNDNLGDAVAGAGDVDGDGLDDILLGAPQAPFMGRGGPGTATLYLGSRDTIRTPRWSYVGRYVMVNSDDLASALGGR